MVWSHPGPIAAVMAAGIGLRDSSGMSETSFNRAWLDGKDYILFECLDNKGDPQGCAVGLVLTRYEADKDGAFVKLRYVGIEDSYYQHWAEMSSASEKFHHVCRRELHACMRKIGGTAVIHIQKWTYISEEEMESCLKAWKVKRLDNTVPGKSKPLVALVTQRSEKEQPTTAAKAKTRKPGAPPPPPPRRSRRPGGGQGRSGEVVADLPEDEDDEAPDNEDFDDEDDDVGRSNAPKYKRKPRRSRSPRREVPRPETARGTVGQMTRTREQKDKGRPTPLDAMLDEEDEDLEQFKGAARFEELRKTLDLKKKKAENKTGAAAVLAQRVQAGPEVKKKRKTEKDKLIKFIDKLSKDKKKRASEESSSSSEEEDEGYLPSGSSGDLVSRQRRLRKMSADKPGCLLIKGYALMHEQLGTLYGDAQIHGSNEEILQPAALRYLLSSALPLMDLRQIGEEKLRELRTLATGLDLLVSGKVSSAGDLFVQRFKSLLMGIRDGTTRASRFLELVPQETYATASTMEENEFARTLAIKEAKSERLLAQASKTG